MSHELGKFLAFCLLVLVILAMIVFVGSILSLAYMAFHYSYIMWHSYFIASVNGGVVFLAILFSFLCFGILSNNID